MCLACFKSNMLEVKGTLQKKTTTPFSSTISHTHTHTHTHTRTHAHTHQASGVMQTNTLTYCMNVSLHACTRETGADYAI